MDGMCQVKLTVDSWQCGVRVILVPLVHRFTALDG